MINEQEWLSLRMSSLWRKLDVYRRLSLEIAPPLPPGDLAERSNERDEVIWKLSTEYLSIDNECLQRLLPSLAPEVIQALERRERERLLAAQDELCGIGEFRVLAALGKLPDFSLNGPTPAQES